ncbi:hypothetical protein EDB83DRAFT_2363899 [Lactarius deliciosus]|nr:hypothetical protein EDB83DRAFT_2363899 [Lactarius deliciosus]
MDVLEAASKFDVRRTSPELHDEFCTLWNQIVRHVLDVDDHRMASWILEPIRNIYVSLHQDTDSAPTRFSASTRNWGNPPWYPVCNIAGHIHGSAPTTFARTALRECAPLVPASLASPDAPSLAMPASLHVVENLTDVPPLDDFRPAHQTTIESLRVPITSPDPAPASATQDTVNSGVTIPHPTPSPLSPTSPPAVVALRHNEDPPDPPSSASYNLVLGNVLPAEHHRSVIVTATPSASSGLSPAPDLGLSVEDVGSPKPDLRKEQDKLGPPSVDRKILANTMATLDFPPQSSSLPSIADLNVAITSHSLKEPEPERLGDPPHPSDHRYDVV